MTLDLEQRKRALAHLGLAWTHRGDEFVVHGDEPSDADLEDAYAAWEAEQAVDPDAELDAGLADVAARTDIPEWGHALLDTLRGQAGHQGRAAGRRPG